MGYTKTGRGLISWLFSTFQLKKILRIRLEKNTVCRVISKKNLIEYLINLVSFVTSEIVKLTYEATR